MKQYSITQFVDPHLSHYAYLIISENEAVVVDPPRDVSSILSILKEKHIPLKAIIETHPHADFVSGHLELHQKTHAPIYVSKHLGADYECIPYDTGDIIQLGAITLESINTPGHSPDSISILLRDGEGIEQVLFSGDTLFVGDVGRPDLRESAGNIQAKREELAGMMYETVQNVLRPLPDHVVVYPAHGAGSLCGKALRDASFTTIGEERKTNPAFQDMTKDAFVSMITEGQPFIPQYFPFDMSVNKAGADTVEESLARIPEISDIPNHALIVDTRSAKQFNEGHIQGALHIAESGLRFETWLGTIVAPNEVFYVIAEDTEKKNEVLHRIAAIGYESNVLGIFVGSIGSIQRHPIDVHTLRNHPKNYTIVDVRQEYEAEKNPLFAHALNIPLNTLRQRVQEIPQEKPIAVHCAGGYRSMVAASIIAAQAKVPVCDIGEKIQSI